MFGDVLNEKIELLATAKLKGRKDDAFWAVLRDIAAEDIKKCYPENVESNIAISTYYKILKDHETVLPKEVVETTPSNNQEKYRIINRNMWTSNAFNADGLANQPGISADKKPSDSRKGYKVIYGTDTPVCDNTNVISEQKVVVQPAENDTGTNNTIEKKSSKDRFKAIFKKLIKN